jgi:hypothetical protein
MSFELGTAIQSAGRAGGHKETVHRLSAFEMAAERGNGLTAFVICSGADVQPLGCGP